MGFTPYYVAGVWCGYDMPEVMYFYGNPSAQIWKRVMSQVHEGLEYKTFTAPVYGRATNIFGDLTEEKAAQDNPSPSPTPTPEPAPEPTLTPEMTEPPEETAPISEDPTAPVETPETPGPETPTPEPPAITDPV